MPKTDDSLIDEILTRGVDAVYPSKAVLKKRLQTGRPITLYLGVDPSGQDLHIGHTIVLHKLRQFQAAGHRVILLIGDFTGQTGDPTDKKAVRVPLTKEQVLANAKHYKKQASTILRFSGLNAAEIRYNSKWLDKLKFSDVAELAGHFTVQQMIERDMFENRLKAGKPISLREFLYPLMVGYDSVAMEVDLEIGGTDQTFNMLAGRKLSKEYLGKEKFVLAMQLLADSSGVKLGKSEGNAIAIAGGPNILYAQVMTLPDEAIGMALELCTSVPASEVKAVTRLAKQQPRDAKMALARAIVAEYHTASAAKKAEAEFVQVVQHKELPTEITETTRREGIAWQWGKEFGVSNSEMRRQIAAGAFKINGGKHTNPDANLINKKGTVLQLGKKKFLRVV